MALLTFELTKRRLSCKVFSTESGNSSTREISFHARSIKDFPVRTKGLLAEGEVHVSEGTWRHWTPEKQWEELLGQIRYYDEYQDRDTKKTDPHFFAIHTGVPIDTFRTLLEMDLEVSSVYLEFSPEYVEGAFVPSERYRWTDPDEWDVKKTEFLNAESVTFEIRPREKQDPLEADTDDSQKPQFDQLLRELGEIKALIAKTGISTDKIYQCAFVIGICIVAMIISYIFYK